MRDPAKHAEYMRKWRENHPTYYTGERVRKYQLKAEYGLTHETFQELLDSQGGKCACCDKDLASLETRVNKRYHVDHDHKTGQVRGILCAGCNTAIGLLGDDVSAVQRAVDYLKSPPKTGV